MTELHDLLAREAERVDVDPGPPFESLAAKAHKRRTATRAASVAAAVIAVTAAIVVPYALRSPSRVVNPAGGPYATASAPRLEHGEPAIPFPTISAAPVVTSGSCAGLTMVAMGDGGEQPIGPGANTLSLAMGATLSLVTSGPCAGGVEFEPTQGAGSVGVQERLSGSSPGASSVSTLGWWAFTAKRQGSEAFTLVLPPSGPCLSVGTCPLGTTTATITVIVEPPADKFHVGISCKAGDLSWALSWKREGVGLAGTLTATNTSGKDCDLLVKPTLAPLDASGKPLGAEFVVSLELKVGPAVLKAGASASSSILWSGWCGPPAGSLMRVTLPDRGTVDVQVSGPTTPGCPASGDGNLSSDWFGPLAMPSGSTQSGVAPSPASSYAPLRGSAPPSGQADGASPSSSGLS